MGLTSTECNRILKLVGSGPISSRDPQETKRLQEECRQRPGERTAARVVWNYVEDVLVAAGLEFELPPPASEKILTELDTVMNDRLGHSAPRLLRALLEIHNGLVSDGPSAFYSTETIIEWVDVLSQLDSSVLTVSGSASGNSAVLRINPKAPDVGRIYAFWHEDYEERGFELLAENLGEYLVLARESIVETVSGQYRGPVELPRID